MASITLTRVKDPTKDSWLNAVARDYAVPKGARVFAGWGLHDDRVAFWIGPDGGGFGAIDKDPVGYVELSRAMEREDHDFESDHPGVDEYVFDPGAFDPDAETLEFDVRSSLF